MQGDVAGPRLLVANTLLARKLARPPSQGGQKLRGDRPRLVRGLLREHLVQFGRYLVTVSED
jgi:hypothetical protein